MAQFSALKCQQPAVMQSLCLDIILRQCFGTKISDGKTEFSDLIVVKTEILPVVGENNTSTGTQQILQRRKQLHMVAL